MDKERLTAVLKGFAGIVYSDALSSLYLRKLQILGEERALTSSGYPDTEPEELKKIVAIGMPDEECARESAADVAKAIAEIYKDVLKHVAEYRKKYPDAAASVEEYLSNIEKSYRFFLDVTLKEIVESE
jgi:hypothetical protein